MGRYLLMLAISTFALGMDIPPKLGVVGSPRVQRIQGSPRTAASPRQPKKDRVSSLACLAARCLAHESDLLKYGAADLITPKDQTCVKEVIIRELIKPHIFPLTISASQNKESVHHNGVCGLDFLCEKNQVISGACDGRIVFCDKNNLATGKAYEFDPLAVSTLHVLQSEPFEIFIGSFNGNLYRMNYALKKLESFKKAHDLSINKICVGNTVLASCSNDKTVKIWEKSTGNQLALLKEFLGAVRGIELFEDDQFLISGSSDGKLKMWNVETQKVVKEYLYPGNVRIWGLGVMNKNNRIIAGFNNGRISLMDKITLQEMGQWYGHGHTIYCLSCDSDEKYFATGSWDNKARLWDVRMRGCAATFVGHTDWVQQIKCIGNEIITGSRDNMLRLWDIRTIKEIDAQALPQVVAFATKLKNKPMFKENHERETLLDELTKKS